MLPLEKITSLTEGAPMAIAKSENLLGNLFREIIVIKEAVCDRQSEC